MLLHSRIKLVDKEQQRFHRFWVRPILETRRTHGNWEHLIQELRLYDHETYFNFMRMTPHTFEDSFFGWITAHATNYKFSRTNTCRSSIIVNNSISYEILNTYYRKEIFKLIKYIKINNFPGIFQILGYWRFSEITGFGPQNWDSYCI